MTASALPAVLMRFPISGVPVPSLDVLRGCDWDDMAEIAESIDEFRGKP